MIRSQKSAVPIQEPFLESRRREHGVFQADGGVALGRAAPRVTAGGESPSHAALHVDRAAVAVHSGEPGVRGGDGSTAPSLPATATTVLVVL